MRKISVIGITILLGLSMLQPVKVKAETITISGNEMQDVLIDDADEISSESAIGSGNLDNGLKWKLGDKGTLTISLVTDYGEEKPSYEMANFEKSENAPWYEYRELVKSIVVSDGVITIGNNSFSDLINAEKLSLGKDVKKIGANAFFNCKSLSEIIVEAAEYHQDMTKNTFPKNMSKIGQNAFLGCISLKQIQFPSSMCYSVDEKTPTGLGQYLDDEMNVHSMEDFTAFIYGSEKAYGVSLRNNMRINHVNYKMVPCNGKLGANLNWEITDDGTLLISGSGVLAETYLSYMDVRFPDVLHVVVPEGITRIDDFFFAGCSNMLDIKLPNSLTSIGDKAFYECYSLKEIDIPDNVTELEDFIFGECYALERVKLPSGLKVLPAKMFYECRSLKEVTLPDGLNEIGNYAFYNCTSLEKIWIPNSVNNFGECCVGCYYMGTLDNTYVESRLSIYAEPGSAAQEYANLHNIHFVVSHDWDKGVLTTAPSCESTGVMTYTCKVCSETKNEDVKSKGHAFSKEYVVDMKASCLKDGLKSRHCTNPGCQKVTEQERIAATGHDVKLSADGKKLVCTNCEAVMLQDGKKFVDKSSGLLYQILSIKKQQVSVVKLKDKKKTNVKIPKSVSYEGKSYTVITIGAKAFKGNKRLKSVTIGSGVTKIGASAFEGCKKLKKVTIKTTKLKDKNVGKKAFKGVAKKVTVKCPKNKIKVYKNFMKKKGLVI